MRGMICQDETMWSGKALSSGGSRTVFVNKAHQGLKIFSVYDLA